MAYGAGSILSISTAVHFFEIKFYWESTLAEGMSDFWTNTITFLSLPWKWSGHGSPTLADVQAIRVTDFETYMPAPEVIQKWAYFMIICIFVWSCIPRVLLLILGKLMYKRALAGVVFEEKRHRQLWRRLYAQPIITEHKKEEQEDGAIFIDFGGIGVKVDKLRPFILQKLRFNPSESYVMGTLGNQQEKVALKLLSEKPQPVILCCEAIEFSPKSLEAVMTKIRMHGSESIHLLLVADVSLARPSEERIEQWMGWVDGLADTDTDLTVISHNQNDRKEANGTGE